MSDDLRRALAALAPRERAALRLQSAEAGEKWAEILPGIGAVWASLAALVEEIERLDRARDAAVADVPERLRPARRARR